MDRRTGSTAGYRDFWTEVGAGFPDLGGARSTAPYLENEKWLFRRYLSPLNGRRILKTDLWDETKNTRILCWAAETGAEAFGVDITPPIVVRASTIRLATRSSTPPANIRPSGPLDWSGCGASVPQSPGEITASEVDQGEEETRRDGDGVIAENRPLAGNLRGRPQQLRY